MRMRDPRTAGSGEPERTAIAGLVALAVAMGIGRFSFTPILPMMQEDAGLSVAAGGWLAAANYLGYLLGALSALGMITRPAAAIRGGLLAIGAATLGMGLGGNFAVWFFLRAAAGMMSAWVLIFVSAWCLEGSAPAGRPILTSVVFSGVGAGITAAGGLCVALTRAGAGSAQAWIVFGALALLAAFAVWPVFHPGRDVPSASGGRPARTALRWRGETTRLVLCYGAFGFGYIIPATFLPAMAKHAIRDPSVFGWSWPAFGAAAAISTLVAAWRYPCCGRASAESCSPRSASAAPSWWSPWSPCRRRGKSQASTRKA